MLVNWLSTRKLTMIQLASKLTFSCATENESWTVNYWTIKGDKTQTRNFARLCVGVLKHGDTHGIFELMVSLMVSLSSFSLLFFSKELLKYLI